MKLGMEGILHETDGKIEGTDVLDGVKLDNLSLEEK
jgi:hypothetical protein